MKDRFQTLLIALVLMGVGALLASFWLEWREPRLGSEASTLANGAPLSDDALEDRLRVEILNGSGDRGAARAMMHRLRDLGFDVVAIYNAESFDYRVTRVINRSGKPGAAREVASSIGADSVGTAVDRELVLDVTVILGKDWRTLIRR